MRLPGNASMTSAWRLRYEQVRQKPQFTPEMEPISYARQKTKRNDCRVWEPYGKEPICRCGSRPSQAMRRTLQNWLRLWSTIAAVQRSHALAHRAAYPRLLLLYCSSEEEAHCKTKTSNASLALLACAHLGKTPLGRRGSLLRLRPVPMTSTNTTVAFSREQRVVVASAFPQTQAGANQSSHQLDAAHVQLIW